VSVVPGILDGKVVAITGAGRGVGRAIAKLAAKEGAKVVVNDFGVTVDGFEPSSGPASEVVQEISADGGTAIVSGDDCASMAGAENIVRAAVETWGKLDGIVHNAGILRPRMIWNMEEDEWDEVIRVHMKGAFTMAKHAALVMRQQQFGTMLFVTSSNGVYGSQSLSNYSAAKAGNIALAKTVAKEMARYNVKAMAYHIGADTRMTRNPQRLAQQRGQETGATANRGERTGGNAPEMGAPLPVFLLSDQAASIPNISGHVFYAGGENLGIYNVMDMERSSVSPGGWTVEEVARVLPLLAGGLRNVVEATRRFAGA
jgi:NAD(P)-dependent dehydrogenase (short-subunit alcohol dehydrogenase family)